MASFKGNGKNVNRYPKVTAGRQTPDKPQTPKGTPTRLASQKAYRDRHKLKEGVASVVHGKEMRKHLRKLGLLEIRDEYSNEDVSAALASLPELACRLLGK